MKNCTHFPFFTNGFQSDMAKPALRKNILGFLLLLVARIGRRIFGQIAPKHIALSKTVGGILGVPIVKLYGGFGSRSKLFTTMLFFVLGLFMSNISNAQILTFDFAGIAGDETTANSNTNNANLTSSTISRGGGLTASANADRFNATSWAVTSIANAVAGNDYMQFTITPNSGFQFSVSSIVFQIQRSGTGISALALRSSVNSYASNLDAEKAIIDNTSTQTITFTFTQSNSSTAVTYRLYGYAESTSGTGGPGDGTGNDITVNGTVTALPSLTVSPTSLTGFTYAAGSGPSTSQSYNLSGANLTGFPGNITITAPAHYEVSTDNSMFSGTTTVAYASATLTSTPIYVRLIAGLSAGNYNSETVSNAGGGATTQNVTCSGTVTSPPALTVSPSSLTGFTYVEGGGPSTSQSYSLSGTNLTGFPADITVTAPSDYEISKDNSAFSSSTTVAYTAATLASTTIYVRLKAGLTEGPYNSELVSNAGGGATTQNVSCSGTVSAPVPVLTVSPSTLSGFTYIVGNGPSASQSYNLSGINLTGFPADITVSGSSNYEVSTDNTNFSSSVTVAYTSATLASTPIYVRLIAGLGVNSYNGEAITNMGGGATQMDVTCNGSVAPTPTLSVTPTSLSGFTYVEGSGPSTSQSYSLSGANLTGFPDNITVTAPTDYEVSKNNSTFSSSVTVAYTSGTLASTPIYVRLKAGLGIGSYNSETVSNAGGGAATENVTCDGSVSAPPPALTVSPSSLTGFTYFQGNGPSSAQSYNLSGTNLTGFPGDITVTGSADYEVSTDNSSFSGSVTVAYTSGTLAPTPVYVRLKAGLNAGNYNSETIANAGGGASTMNVTCSGSVTIASLTTITAGAGAEPATISALSNTQGSAVQNFDIDITDDGGSGGDALATLISQIQFTQGTNNDVADWALVIEGAELSDGTNSMTGTIAATTITFAGINTADLGLVADNATKNYTLKVWLKSDLTTLKTTIDGSNLEFRIQNANVTTDVSGSGMATGQSQTSGATNNAIDVQATALAFVQGNNASNATVSVAMSPVKVSANDANGNRDRDYVTAVSITSTGTLTGTPVNVTPVAGEATFSGLIHSAAGTGLQLTAASGALSSVLSSLFDIADVSLTGDYFRSNAATGTWATAATWQSSHDNSTWITATLAPTSASAGITIQSGHVITISSSVTVDQVVVANGGTLSTSAVLTVSNGTGDDIVVQNGGTVIYTGLPTYNTSSTIRINTGGILSLQAGSLTSSGSIIHGASHVYDDASILDFNVASTVPSASGVTYFPNAGASTIPVLRLTTTNGGSLGGGSNTIINGLFEVNTAAPFQSAGTKTFRNGISGSGAVTQGSAGQFIINGTSAVLTGSGTLTLGAAGLLVNSGADITGDKLIAGAGALTKQGSGTLFLSNASNTYSLGTTITAGTVSVDGPNRLGSSAGSLTIATASFQCTAASGISSARNIVLTGSPSTIDITTSSYIATSAAVVSGSGPLTKTGAGILELQGTNTYTGLTTVSGGTFRLNKTGGTTIPATNSISVDNGATLRVSSNQTLNTLTLANGSTLLVDDGMTLTITGTLNQNGGTITVGTGVIAYGASGTLSYGGSSAQNATGVEFPSSSGPLNLTINNSNGVSLNNLSFAPVLNGTLTFTSGKLTLGANNLVIGSSGVISGATSSKYVVTDAVGALTRNGIGNMATLFPVGDGSYYTPVTLTNGGTTDNFSVNFTSASSPSCLDAASAVTATWEISEAVATGSNCTIAIDYGSVPFGGSFTAGTAKIGHCTGASYDYYSGSAAGTLVTGTGFTSFSPFGITSEIPLPVELTTFNANLRNRKTYLNWATASEHNNAFFSIERSTDGVEFRSIGKVNGAGDSNTARSYGFVDEKPAAGVNFYRLKQVDFDGKFEYSKSVSVTVGKTGSITLSPVPAQDQLHVNLETALTNDGTWQLLDNTGRLIQSGTIPAETFDFNVDVTTLTPGAYFLRMVDGQTVVTKQFQK